MGRIWPNAARPAAEHFSTAAVKNRLLMRITYDSEAPAIYVYFTDEGNGHSDTRCGQVAEFDFDDDGRIISLRAYEHAEDGRTYLFGDKLRFALINSNVHYDGDCVSIAFAQGERNSTVTSDCNLDIDEDNQIVGIEVLFPPLGALPDKAMEHVLRWRLNR